MKSYGEFSGNANVEGGYSLCYTKEIEDQMHKKAEEITGLITAGEINL